MLLVLLNSWILNSAERPEWETNAGVALVTTPGELEVTLHVGPVPKVSFDAPRFQDIAFAPQILVRWLSGRKRRFAKALYSLSGTEGSNPSLTAF